MNLLCRFYDLNEGNIEIIEEITKEKISFIIAHRLFTIEKCDKILLMKYGRIVEAGNHNELINRRGESYSLVNAVV